MSSSKGASSLSEAVRSHWGIENSLHWVLDVVFKEDDSRIRMGHGDWNFSVIRRIALNLIRQNKEKGSLNSKRLRCGWDQNFLCRVLQISQPI